jgi:exopolysaccharide biosynthesis protein
MMDRQNRRAMTQTLMEIHMICAIAGCVVTKKNWASVALTSVLMIAGLSNGDAMADSTVISDPYIGITKIDAVLTSPRTENIHILKIDLTAPGISFKISSATPSTPAGTLGYPVGSSNQIANETSVQKTLDYLKQENAQFAVNVAYFGNPSASNGGTYITGFISSLGNVYSSFESNPALSYAIVPNAPGINIDSNNNASIVVRGSADNEIASASGGSDISAYNTFTGSAQIITNGAVTIPTYTDAGGVLVSNGTYKTGNSWYDQINARTIVGLSEDENILYILTVDKAGGSLGASVTEMANYLVNNYGVYNALNLDGGGSTTLAWVDPSTSVAKDINVSSNGATDRAEGANFAIFASPVPEPSTLGVVVVSGIVLLARGRRRTRMA